MICLNHFLFHYLKKKNHHPNVIHLHQMVEFLWLLEYIQLLGKKDPVMYFILFS